MGNSKNKMLRNGLRIINSTRSAWSRPSGAWRRYADEASEKAAATALTLNLSTPHKSIIAKKEISMVTVPGSAGYFGVSLDHVPTVAELKPGLITVHETEEKTEHYFTSGGFVFMNEESVCDIAAIECVPVEALDPNAVKQGLEEHQRNLTSSDESVAAKAAIGVEAFEGMQYAL